MLFLGFIYDRREWFYCKFLSQYATGLHLSALFWMDLTEAAGLPTFIILTFSFQENKKNTTCHYKVILSDMSYDFSFRCEIWLVIIFFQKYALWNCKSILLRNTNIYERKTSASAYKVITILEKYYSISETEHLRKWILTSICWCFYFKNRWWIKR